MTLAPAAPVSLHAPTRQGGDHTPTRQAGDSAPSQSATVTLPCQDAAVADLFFSERSHELEAAKAACARCPLVQECFEGAQARQEPWGVWGGQIFVDGAVVAAKRSRGRPRKNAA